MDPLVFEPYFRPQVWGSRRLADRLGKALPAEGNFGESWEISGHPQHVSHVAEGPLAGTSLQELCQRHGRELFGAQPPQGEFPLLIKYLDCHVPLSVQVHPNDELARQLLGEDQGKTEAWVILDADPAARVYAGLRPGTTRESLEHHLDAGTVADCLHEFHPQAGDCVFLPAGTVHAVGDGVLIAEVQQTSDATFRLWDWNRLGPDGKPRALHRQQALAAIDWSAGPVAPVHPQPLGDLTRNVTGERLVDSPYFRMDRLQISGESELAPAGVLSIWMVLGGTAVLQSKGGYRREFSRGETVLVPAAAPRLEWSPGTAGPVQLLRVVIPASTQS
ncbi:MAG TPA: type I phosphomannose isomerase catalytic subunit [Planctomycetaceae bacterium]|nr:type I phosphomannose isomerase catalytic subunit [Planctomycetaceae bacterium]